MTQKKYNHIHKLRRDRYSTGRAYFYCINGDCNFKIDTKHALGKPSICNECGLIFDMNEYSIRAAKPKCMNCVKRRNSAPIPSDVNLDDIIGDLDAINVDRHQPTTIHETQISTKSIQALEERLSNLIVKEYNPEDESDEL